LIPPHTDFVLHAEVDFGIGGSEGARLEYRVTHTEFGFEHIDTVYTLVHVPSKYWIVNVKDVLELLTDSPLGVGADLVLLVDLERHYRRGEKTMDSPSLLTLALKG
jgi:hypothetical protein